MGRRQNGSKVFFIFLIFFFNRLLFRELPFILENVIGEQSKINIVCGLLLNFFSTQSSDKYLLSTITTLVKCEPPRSDEALSLVQKLKGKKKKKKRVVFLLGYRFSTGCK